ncbi:hypothetical protein GGF32_006866 [Allomyces javanicus]|nr:hypothetical protein GGF32_006866 [Allomyces javanicus]
MTMVGDDELCARDVLKIFEEHETHLVNVIKKQNLLAVAMTLDHWMSLMTTLCEGVMLHFITCNWMLVLVHLDIWLLSHLHSGGAIANELMKMAMSARITDCIIAMTVLS